MKTVIVIPTYNEAKNISELIDKIFALGIANLEIIFVDDNSPDGTANIIRSKQNNHPIHLISRKEKLGLGSAYKVGFTKAIDIGADFIFEMDADFSHDPADIPKLLQTAREKNCGLVIGSRKIPGGRIIGWSKWRQFMSTGAMWFSRKILKLKVLDVTAGFRCFSRAVLANMEINKINSNGYAFQEELLYHTQKLGYKICEIPVIFFDRQKGKSKLSKKTELL